MLMRQPQERLVSFLASEADGVYSPLLLMLATWLLIFFFFVKGRVFIKVLIVRLKEDSAVDADHKSWCDAKLWRNGQVPNRAEAVS